MTGLESTFTDFNKRIPIGDMMVNDEASVFVWTKEGLKITVLSMETSPK
jgi:hypothetical protein